MEDSAVRLQDNLQSLDAAEDIHALHTYPGLTSRSNRDFEAAAAVAAADAASGSQPFDALPAATAAVANNLHPSTVTSQDDSLPENPATPQSLRRPHQQQQQLTQAHHQHQLHPPNNSNGFLEHTNSSTVDMLDHLQTSLPPHLLNQFHDATPPMGGGESPLSPAINKGEPYFKNMKLISNPPDLKRWRERLFNVEDTIVLSEEEFQTYFPHIDNVYSHRSTQKYKRKLFVSHYWDCRLKGRPPGTPKSRDPNKKKRKRTARERDLCDVKIKITEYLPGALTTPPGLGPSLLSINSPSLTTTTTASSDMQPATSISFPGSADQSNGARPHVAGHHPQSQSQSQLQYPFGVLAPSATLPEGHPGAAGARYYTIQRVNGNGGNGRTGGIGGPHRHTLEESDRIKKNSVQRYLLKEEKERKRIMVQQKTYHKKASGSAAVTVKKHAKEADLKLFGSCFW
ncbi:predicted protein [Histoplasma mississippiense (nom. inval.)]|uniref:predicted protein n=1 Tax=Ajellomyces capsulatus (strain NAm1 / WU24) TaxID=2059318 RepID=UPI000157B72E|nr:predicted protein [Histoplasma mississippiense (nom. inval.)]EDN03656.1 predicted protein [Histoplasma mississippiense (nom. inval.)]